MKKIYSRSLLVIGILAVIFFVSKATGIFQSYKVPSGAMEPTIKVGSRLYATNLKKPKRNAIIIYKRIAVETDGIQLAGQKATFTHRLIAFGGETVEIKNDLAYVNGKLVDDTTKLQFPYSIKKDDLQKVDDALKKDQTNDRNLGVYYPLASGQYSINLSYEDFIKVKSIATPERIINDEMPSPYLFNPESKNWTVSNYGPIKVPENHYFVLGDNRSQSADSRYHGPILASNWVGTAL